LLAKNYLYTSANYAFLSANAANFAKVVLEHPSIIEPNSTFFRTFLDDSIAEIDELISDLGTATVTIENKEWIVSARQRALWAKEKLMSTEDAFNTNLANNLNDPGESIQRVRETIDAQGWISASRNMLSTAEALGGSPIEVSVVSSLAEELVVSIEDEFSNDDTAVFENADLFNRYFKGAKIAIEKKWFLTGLYSAAVAKGVSDSEAYNRAVNYPDADLDAFSSALSVEVNNIDTSIADSSGIYDALFWQHAKYFVDAGNYYLTNDRVSSAKAQLTTASMLYFVSRNLNVASLAADSLIKPSGNGTVAPKEVIQVTPDIMLSFLSGLIIFLVLLVFTGMIMERRVKNRRYYEHLLSVLTDKHKENLIADAAFSAKKHEIKKRIK
ncbi:MAG: hypothetical protein GOV15_00250, partial [Candidatus Diapherotrites archaeon]|nr:hypothetical protein [Candidatus Diapherotrites archaeon]